MRRSADRAPRAGGALPTRWAYGLWKWLENKFEFQSREADNVLGLLKKCYDLAQEPSESFDAYDRTRVNKLQTDLLTAAGDPPSAMAQVYNVTLLEKLQP